MFHANSQRIIADWNARRGVRLAPRRADISPADFRDLLPQLFILGRGDDGDEPFRLAGGLLVDLHGRDLRQVCFYSLWSRSDAVTLRHAMATARSEASPVVLQATAWTAAGDDATLEIVAAPLTGATGEMDRTLGLYQPTASLRRLMGAPVSGLVLDSVRLADGEEIPARPAYARPSRAHLRLVASGGERIA